MIYGQRSFYQRSDTGSTFQMTDLRLDRSHGNARSARTCFVENLGHGVGLYHVAHRRGCSMGLHEADVGRVYANLFVCTLHS